MNDSYRPNTMPFSHHDDPAQMNELVRGNAQFLLDCMMPLVKEQNVTLDLRRIVRIDAAGLAALIKLYCAARDAGRRFGVRNPTAHVAEFLTLVRLNGLLVSPDSENFPSQAMQLQESAA
jgi:anti-anti-sigma regulatory factor